MAFKDYFKGLLRPISPFRETQETPSMKNDAERQEPALTGAQPEGVRASDVLSKDTEFNLPKGNIPTEPMGYADFVLKYSKPQDLTEDIRRAERERKMHMFGNVATVLGQGLGSLMGARQFTPVQSNDAAYQQRIDRLRDAQRQYNIDYDKNLLQARYQDYAQKLADKRLAEQREYNERLTAEQREYEKEKADDALERQIRLQSVRNENTMEQIAARGEQARATQTLKNNGNYSVQILRNASKSGSGSSASQRNEINMVEYELPKGYWNNKATVDDLWRYVPEGVKAETGKIKGREYDYLTKEYVSVRQPATHEEKINAIVQCAGAVPEIENALRRADVSGRYGGTSASAETVKKSIYGEANTDNNGKKRINW